MSKTALVTGAGGNVGRAVVDRFASDGHKVYALVSPGSKTNFSAGIQKVELDVLDEASAEETIGGLGPIDVAVLTVGGFAMGDVLETDGAALDSQIRLNFYAAYFTARPLFRQMLGQPGGGRIFLVGSKTALQKGVGKGAIAYNLAKSLIFKFAEYLNAEGHNKNVVTHVVAPSTIDTPVNRKSMPDADFDKWVKPEAIAEVIAFASSKEGAVLREMVLKVYGDA